MIGMGRLRCHACRSEMTRFVKRFQEDGLYWCPACDERAAEFIGPVTAVSEQVFPGAAIAFDLDAIRQATLRH